MQSFVDIPSTDSLQNSRLKILNNDKTIMSCHSGAIFPTTNLEVGMFCFRTDLNQVFELKNLTPSWILVADLNKTYTNKEYVDEKISNHGIHLPALQTANNAVFLRNDGTWQTVTVTNIGAAPTSHNHDAGNINTGTLPVARGGTGNATGAPASHNHDASNINAGTLPVARGGTGNATGNAATADTAKNSEKLGGQTAAQIIAAAAGAVTGGNTVTVITGALSQNASTHTLPLPSGFTESQCTFFTILGTRYDVTLNGGGTAYVYSVSVSTSRTVYLGSLNGITGKTNNTGSYIVIGVK